MTKELRDCLIFTTHSLLRDPPFSRLDLISCRNLMIYLDRELQQQVIGVFRYALRPGRFLFLGASESAEGAFFHVVDKKHHIFQAREVTGDDAPHLPELLLTTPHGRTPDPREPPPPAGAVHRRCSRISGRRACSWTTTETSSTSRRRPAASWSRPAAP